jgi:ATP-dependent protease ClpP protease subunit
MANLTLFGEIGFEVTAEETANFLGALPSGEPLEILLNSAGGDLQEATAIFNLLRSHDGPVAIEITGWALSARSLIAMAGSNIKMHENTLMMIHAPWVMSGGNARDLRETADMLDIAKSAMVLAYTRRGIPRATVEEWLSGEQDYWFTADEALNVGLIDEVISASQPVSVKNCPFTIPQQILDKVMKKQPKKISFMATIGERVSSVINPEAKAQQEAIRAEVQRKDEIKRMFHKSLHYEGMQEVMNTCLNDPHCTREEAGQRCLEHMAKDAEPIQGRHCFSEDQFSMPSQNQRIENFKAMAADAILMRAGFPVKKPHPAAGDLRGKSIVAIAENMLSLMGKTGYGSGPSAIIKAAQSTSDFPDLLGAITGRALRQGYELAQSTHAIWTAERDVADFRAQTLIQLSEAPGLEKVLEGGEYTSSYFSESAETFSVETFGRIVSLTRQALINDDLNAFTRIPAAFGASARRKECTPS